MLLLMMAKEILIHKHTLILDAARSIILKFALNFNGSDRKMEAHARRVTALQAIITLSLALIFYMAGGPSAAEAALYGGAVALANNLSHVRRATQAEKAVLAAPARAFALIYGGAIGRTILTLGLFALAFGFFRLHAAPALFVFAAAQLAYGWAMRASYKDLL